MSTIPKFNRPDGMPSSGAGSRQWIKEKLAGARALTYVGAYGPALDKVQEAEHGLRVLMLEQRASEDGIVEGKL
jgi:hypothetical protein